MDELKRVHANLKTMPMDRILVELATIKKRASRSDRMAEAILPLMQEIHTGLAQGGGGGAGAATSTGGGRSGKVKISAKRKSARILAVVVGALAIFVGVVMLALRGGSESDAKKSKKAPETKETKKTK
jgi:preprotein translocase subunit SecG